MPNNSCSPDFSHFPSIPPPLDVDMAAAPEHVCNYLPDRTAKFRAFLAGSMEGDLYHQFMDSGFRRSGRMIYQPVCRGCRKCISVRIPIAQFSPSRSQRRCVSRNSDVDMKLDHPKITDEKCDLYNRYLQVRHNRPDVQSPELIAEFLYSSPVNTVEMEYRNGSGQLIGVGICDVSHRSISSVYFYFDPVESRRSLGTFSILREIELAGRMGIPHLYLGYWVVGCQAMEYKKTFAPAEFLDSDGEWRKL